MPSQGRHLTAAVQYCIVLTKLGEVSQAYEVCKRLSGSNVVWSHDDREVALSLCHLCKKPVADRQCSRADAVRLAACALYARNFAVVFEGVNRLIVKFQFYTEPLRLANGLANAGGFYALTAFAAPSLLKRALGRLRFAEVVVARRPHRFTGKRWTSKEKLSEAAPLAQMSGARGDEADADEPPASDDEASDADHEGDAEAEAEAPDAEKAARDAAALAETERAFAALDEQDRARYCRPTEYNPAHEMQYGSMLLATGSFQSATGTSLGARKRAAADAARPQATGTASRRTRAAIRSSTSAPPRRPCSAPCSARPTIATTLSSRCAPALAPPL